MAEENVLRTRLEFIFNDVKNATKAVEEVRQALNEVAPAAEKAQGGVKSLSTAVRGYNETLQSRWTQQFKKDLGILPSQIKAAEKAVRSLNAALMAQDVDRGRASSGALQQLNRQPATRAQGVGSSFGAIDPQIYQRDAHVKAFQEVGRQREMASKQTAIYNQYLHDEEKASNKAAAAADQLAEPSLPRLRYALYDVSTTLSIASAGLTALSVATISAAAGFETAFTGVERTITATSFQLDFIRDQLLVLSREIPLSFAEISQIASLGGQLGVAKTDLASFTETVAQFASVTNVSIDQAAQSFGSLGELLNVPAGEFQNLGSAIALVGVNSVATETEILSVANQIAGVSAAAGMSADFVVGLSGALASLRLPAEQSRGALTKVFQQVNRASAEGGEAIAQFAAVLGVSTAEAEKLASTDMETFFTKFITGLGGLDAQQLTTTLDTLGLSELRVTNTLTRLAGNLDLVNETMALSNEGYESGSVLALLYSKRVDDVAAKFQILLNGLTELAATAGEALLPVLGPIIDGFTEFLNIVSDLLSTDTGKTFAGFVIGGAALLAVLFAVGAAVAVGIASLAALKTAMIELGLVSKIATTGLKGFTGGMIGVATATGGASVALRVFKVALAATGIGLAVVALGTLAAAFMEVGDNSTQAFNRAVGTTGGLAEAVKADTLAYQEAVAAGNATLAATFTEFTVAGEEGANKWDEQTQRVINAAEVLGTEIPKAFFDATGAIDDNTFALGENTQAWFRNQLLQSEAFQELAGNQEFLDLWKGLGADFNEVIAIAAVDGKDGINAYFIGLAEQAYASGAITAGALNSIVAQLEGGLAGAFQGLMGQKNLFGEFTNLIAGAGGALQLVGFDADAAGSAFSDADEDGDGLSDSLDDVSNAARGAAKEVYTLVNYANDLSGIFSRAFDIRFKSQLAMDDITKTWESLTERIRAARLETEKLTADKAVKEYFLSVAEAYGDDLRAGVLNAEIAEINNSIADSQANASTELEGNSAAAIGNREELAALVKEYQDYIAALAESGADQATLTAAVASSQAEFAEQARALGFSNAQLQPYIASFRDMTTVINNVPRNITVTANTNPALQALNEFVALATRAGASAGSGWSSGMNAGLAKTARGLALQAKITEQQAVLQTYLASGNISGARYLGQYITILANKLASGNYAQGGYTGSGGKYEPAGIVHKGEYVVPKSQVNQSTGLPYANALGGQMPASRGPSYAGGGPVTGGGSMMVELGPKSMSVMRQAVQKEMAVYFDNVEVARVANAGNRQIVAMGGRP